LFSKINFRNQNYYLTEWQKFFTPEKKYSSEYTCGLEQAGFDEYCKHLWMVNKITTDILVNHKEIIEE